MQKNEGDKQMNSTAKIISHSLYGEEICASSAKISTTTGNSCEIFEKSKDTIKNRELIRKVLSLGHKSIVEHIVFSIALCNVSAVVEEFFIEHRLASFTVKSRRYVDYSQLGYYIPPDLDNHARETYCHYMDTLFRAYHDLIGLNIPKEDARFLLPYSFHSNFYCTLNARELLHLLHAIRYEHGQDIPELQDLANQIIIQLEELCPYLLAELNQKSCEHRYIMLPGEHSKKPVFIQEQDAGNVELLQAPSKPREILEMAYTVNHPNASAVSDYSSYLKSSRARELEQLSYTFRISGITLSCLTHIVRHRMQSVIMPSIQNISTEKCIMPNSIHTHSKACKKYYETIEEVNGLRERAMEIPALCKYRYYYLLSGNMTDIITTINARELETFIRLRACNRAQWEIREIAMRMAILLRQNFSELYNLFGPSCYSMGACPEGRLTCGEMGEVISRFSAL